MKKIIISGLIALMATTASAEPGVLKVLDRGFKTVWFGTACGLSLSFYGCNKFDKVDGQKTLAYKIDQHELEERTKEGKQIYCKKHGYPLACKDRKVKKI